MNVITGETGAGKSILMGALSLILGERADSTVLLNREKKCIVEGVFAVDEGSQVMSILNEHELTDNDAASEVVIRREIGANGKSRAFVNDTPVNLDQLKLVSSLLVDLHRQFDTLSLGESRFQLNVLDALAGNRIILDEYAGAFMKWKSALDELKQLQLQKSTFTKEYDYNKFLFDELDEAAFKENELEEGEQELKLLSNAEGIRNALTACAGILIENDEPVLHQIKSVQQQLESYAKFHPPLSDVVSRLRSVHIELQDIAGDIEKMSSDVSYDERRIEKLNERLSTGYKLLKKHGVQTTAQLLSIYEDLSAKLAAVMNIDDSIAANEKHVAILRAELETLSLKISDERHKQIKPLEQKVNKLLVQVGMPNARLQVQVGEQELDATGKDDVEFLFDANKSNRFEPIRKVASGGELSRLMLSIKSLVAESMDMPTLIFDEIDTGISGEAARQVGIIMQSLARNRQIITITHQPQIAGKADAHLLVYKEAKKESVRTNIRVLDGEERVVAIAKMLSGEKPTAAALENAREMVMN
jgi:DNA repair protein RecN (Recombination protein N)